MWKLAVRSIVLGFALLALRAEWVNPDLFKVELSARATASPPAIALNWIGENNATNYTVSRRQPGETGWSPIANLPGTATNFVDTNVTLSLPYEYQVLKNTSSKYIGSGYLYSGIEVPPVEYRETVILLIESTWKTPLAFELSRLRMDLIGDGWNVIQHYFPRSASVQEVKAFVQQIHQSDPSSVRALFLLGHIAVPYSGDYAADSHENHRGAWPADTFYGDMDGVWTDTTVNNVNAEKWWNHNIPGDGKFDQSSIPSDIELEVGRVDLSNLTCFANKTPARDELALLRQYLNKDHAFRHGNMAVPNRGLICYNFEDDHEGLRATLGRNHAPLFGFDSTVTVPWGSFFPTLNNEGFLFAYGAGGGGYYSCAGIGSSDDFAVNDIKAVFTFYFGSYLGDWDNESNFLRAALGSTSYTLTSAWAGRPNWFLHHMGLGETIGYATRLTQNNVTNGVYQPAGIGNRAVHTALMGDPTLRLHPIRPPDHLSIAPTDGGFDLTWDASDDDVLGYLVYRSEQEGGPYQRISGDQPLHETRFVDSDGLPSSVYMVRAVALTVSGSGSYYNLSQGIFGRAYELPSPPTQFHASASSTAVTLTWQDNSNGETGFRVYRTKLSAGTTKLIGSLAANSTSFFDTNVTVGESYRYSLSVVGLAGEAFASDDVSVTILAGSAATLVGIDRTTGGSWKGQYGAEGFNVINDSFHYPQHLSSLSTLGQSSWVWNWNATDPAALQRASATTRLAACWYSHSPFEITFAFADTNIHRISFYFLDWDRAGRNQTLQLLDSNSGTVLATQEITDFATGVYATFDLKGSITARLTPNNGNAVLSGLFFDSPLPTVASPVISPGGGKHTNSVEVSISAPTPDSTVFYTLDGSTPTTASLEYTAPLTLTNSTTLSAKAFVTGMNPSTVAVAEFTVVVPTGPPVAQVTFNGVDTTLQGSWKGEIGAEGHMTMGDSHQIPSYVTVGASGKSDWMWQYTTGDTRAVQRNSNPSRLAACWYSGTSFDVLLDFKDNDPHRVRFYCLDWDFGGRKQRVEIVDVATEQVLHSQELESFTGGVYLDYTITGPVIARFTRITSYNAVLSGIFFDSAD